MARVRGGPRKGSGRTVDPDGLLQQAIRAAMTATLAVLVQNDPVR